MFGLSFLNPALLYGSLLVGAPILIHLLNRRRFRIVPWAAMEFLLEADLKNRRRVRIEHILLLLLRCLLILLVAFLVSRPFLRGGSLLPFIGALEKESRIILLDDSMSMGHRPTDRSAFDAAKEGLLSHLEVLRRERPNDPVTICLASRPDAPILTEGYLTEAKWVEVQEMISGLEVGDGTLALGTALETIHEGIPEAQREMPRSITIVTDLRRVDYFDKTGAPDPHLLDGFVAFEETPVKFFLADVGHADEANVGVVALEAVDPHLIAGIPARIQAKITNFGREPSGEVSVAFTVGESAPPPTFLGRLDPGETRTVPFPFAFPDPGSRVVRAEVGADPLAADNLRRLALEVRQHLEVVLVDGEPAADPGEDEVFFLVHALSPSGEVPSGVNARSILERTLGEERLDGVDAIVLANVYAVPEQIRPRLEEFVRSGGGLVIFLGDQADPDLYNRHLYRDGAGLLPASIGEGREEEVRFSGEGLVHPIFQVFSGPNNPFLRRVRVHQTVLPTSPPSGDGRVILTYDDPEQTPAVMEKPFGKGRVILFFTACDREWSGWPTDPSYLVAMQELIQYVARTPAVATNLQPGNPIEFALDPTRFETEAVLRTPGYPEEEPVPLSAIPREDDQTLWYTWRETARAGEYHLIQTGRDGLPGDQAFSVNPDAREGDLQAVDEAEIRNLLPEADLTFVSDLSTARTTRAEGDAEAWRALGYLFVLILFAELLLGWRFGHHLRDE